VHRSPRCPLGLVVLNFRDAGGDDDLSTEMSD
jgi:hypothetical protein